jgi:hypothetical protein
MKTLNQFLQEQSIPSGIFKGVEGSVDNSRTKGRNIFYIVDGDRLTPMQKILQNIKSMGLEGEIISHSKSSIGIVRFTNNDGETLDVVVKNPVGAKGPSGEDWEALIVVGMNANQGRKWDTGAEWERVKKYWGSYEEPSRKLATEFQKKLGVTQLSQTGSSRASLTSDWSKWGATNKTPKTDLFAGNLKISLKKTGGSQLMSGFKEETIATFYAAMKTYSADSKTNQNIQKVMKTIEDKMIKLTQKDTITSINKLKKKDASLLTPEELAKIEEVNQGQLNAKEINAQLDKLFDDQAFKAHLCFEAATGNTKFGKDSDASSNIMVTFTEDGKIDHTLRLDDPMKAGMVLAKTNKIYVSFKSSAGSPPYLSLRTNKTDDPKKWIKTLKLTETFEDIVREESKNVQFLDEDLQQLDEFAILRKLRGVAGELVDKAKEVIGRIIQRVQNAFTYILSLGDKALNAFVRFFGLEVSKVSYTQSKVYPLFDE